MYPNSTYFGPKVPMQGLLEGQIKADTTVLGYKDPKP